MTVMLSAATILFAGARAGAESPSIQSVARLARVAVVVPQEWDGVWTTLDSIYTCAGAFQSTSTGADTVCGGKDYQTSAPGSSIVFTCTGTADATTIDMTCTGSGPVFTDCNADYTIVVHGTLASNSYHLVDTVNITYSGTGTGCDLLPPQCIQLDSWGTRTGPAPQAFCLTPARKSTWGELKALYR
jgi:hypothetical protein